MSKLKTLVGSNSFAAFEDYANRALFDGVAEGICINPDCDYTTDVEPDCRNGYCECCGTQTVKSGLVLAGII